MAASPNGQQKILSAPSPWKWFQRPCFLFMFTLTDWSIDMFFLSLLRLWHYVKSVQIRSFPGPYFPIFGLNTEIYGINLCIQSEYGNIRTRKKLRIWILFTQCGRETSSFSYGLFSIASIRNHTLNVLNLEVLKFLKICEFEQTSQNFVPLK